MAKLSLFFFCMLLFACNQEQKTHTDDETIIDDEKIKVTKIWDKAPHNAFTDLIHFNGAFYCSFREGSAHVPGTDGKARILKSVDGINWESVALIEKEGIDLRDPKISVTPDNRIMVIIGGSDYENGKLLGMYPHVSFSDTSGSHFSEAEKVSLDPQVEGNRNWIWRVTWNKGIGYGINYGNGSLQLLKTKDGKHFELVSNLEVDGYPNESTIRFDENDKIHVLIRREKGDQLGLFAHSAPPYTDWNYSKFNMRLGGPDFIYHDDKILIGSRLYESNGNSTAVIIADREGNIQDTIKLPSQGDSSYPGMVVSDQTLMFTYYSSHEGKTSIYLAKIPLREI